MKFKVQSLSGLKEFDDLDIDENKALLDFCDLAKVKMPFGCRAGSCGVCRVVVVKGLELLENPGFVEEDTLSRCQDSPEVRLACQARFKVDALELSKKGSSPDIEFKIAPEAPSMKS